MKNMFERMFQNKKKVAKNIAIGTLMLAAVEGVEAQNNKIDADQFLKDNNIQPKWEIDMDKYPGMHPSKAFELDGYNKLDLPGKIQWTRDAIEAEKKNLQIDLQMGESEEQIKKDKEEIQKLKQQLLELQRQGEPSV